MKLGSLFLFVLSDDVTWIWDRLLSRSGAYVSIFSNLQSKTHTSPYFSKYVHLLTG